MFRKGNKLDKLAEEDGKAVKEAPLLPRSSSYPEQCVFCYGDSYAALTKDMKIPSTYYNEVRVGKEGDPICGKCLIVGAFLIKADEAKKFGKPASYQYDQSYGGGLGYHHYRDREPESVRGKRTFAKDAGEKKSESEKTAERLDRIGWEDVE